MELEKMKAVWSKMSDKIEHHETGSTDEILKLARKKSSSGLNRIIFMESVGLVICVVVLIYLLIHFNRLEHWLSLAAGIGTICMLLIAMYAGINIIYKAKRIDIVKNSYQETLTHFGQLKRVLGWYKWLSIFFYIIMPFLLFPVIYSVLLEKDFIANFSSNSRAIVFSYVMLPIILYLFFKVYKKNIRKVNHALEEVADTESFKE